MKRIFLLITNKFLNKKLDFRVRLFNVLAIAGITISLLIAGLSVIVNAGALNVFANLFAAVFACVLLYYTNNSGRYYLGYLITIIVIFFILFPILFFSTGGYHSGMPSFFIFAFLFTVFMLDGKPAIIMVTLETLLYAALCLIAYYYPKCVTFFETEDALLIDTLIGFVTVSVAIGITLFMYIRLYNEQQRLLAEQNAELDRLNQLKTEFLANVSHELKTPLTIIMGIAQNAGHRLAEGFEPNEMIKEMQLVTSESNRLSLMVGQILDVTRIEEGKMICDMRKCSIEEIIQTTVNAYYPLLKKNSNRLIIRTDENLPAVNADAGRISQVLVNLLQNAIRHTVNGTITIYAKADESFVKITVRDTGEGIEPERLPLIFERFKSHDSKKNRGSRDTGTGLGLYICKHIIEIHGGEIVVTSEAGKGCAVWFTVPFYSIHT